MHNSFVSRQASDMAKVRQVFPRAPQYFKQWRQHRELNQDQAAERAQTTQETISRWESGKIEYDKSTLEALAHAYRCEPADLLRPPVPPDNDVAAYVMRLDAKRRSQALRIIKAMLDEDAA